MKFARELALDAVAVALTGVIAVALAAGWAHVGAFSGLPWLYIVIAGAVHLLTLFNRGTYSLNPRYVGLYDVMILALSAALPATILSFAEWKFRITGHNTGIVLVFVLYAFFSTSFLIGLRLLYGTRAWKARSKLRANHAKKMRTLVVGAGDAGETIVREVARSQKGTNIAIGFVDDDDAKQSLRIHGVQVLGKIDDIPDIVDKYRVDEILIAIPVASGPVMRRIFNLCAGTSARVRTLPGLQGLLDTGNSLTRQLREVQIEDLLRRAPVKTNLQEIAQYISGEHVMITGGGGSIGSELARQVARMHPASLILVGKGENSIYEIEQELIQTTGLTPITVVADVRDHYSMNKVFREHQPTVVFHAAAHKHVPLMQKNIAEAVRNNVLGSLNVADLSVRNGVKKFILISTDKAVHPSSVMGATKRICEMIMGALGQTTETEFAAVRFGNVLGSRGSLIPLLTAQIKRGGPVTVTHPEMTRYFMTIPEAVQLVLQAGALGGKGEIFILDMGEPVKIEDLALELIRLHGLMPGDDIAIKYTGIRPGEKLHEELVYDKEDLRETRHPKIRMVAKPDMIDLPGLRRDIEQLVRIATENDPEVARQFLMELAWRKNMAPSFQVGKPTSSKKTVL